MKKILTIVISVALVAAIAIGGTLAFLTSNAGGTTLTNTFVSGPGLSITLDEGAVNESDGKFTNAGVTRRDHNSYPVIPGETMDKDPRITIMANSEPCYVFAYVSDTATTAGKKVVSSIAIDTAHWKEVASNTTGGKLYVYTTDPSGDSTKSIVPKSTANQPLPEVFKSFTINSTLTVADVTGARDGNITVQAYAYQSTSVTYEAALGVVKATFGVA